MAHAQKPDFVFRRNGGVHFNRQGRQFSRLLAAEVCASAVAGYTMFRGRVKGTGYPHHSPVSPSLPLPCVTACHHVSTGLYQTNSPQGTCCFALLSTTPRRACTSDVSTLTVIGSNIIFQEVDCFVNSTASSPFEKASRPRFKVAI